MAYECQKMNQEVKLWLADENAWSTLCCDIEEVLNCSG